MSRAINSACVRGALHCLPGSGRRRRGRRRSRRTGQAPYTNPKVRSPFDCQGMGNEAGEERKAARGSAGGRRAVSREARRPRPGTAAPGPPDPTGPVSCRFAGAASARSLPGSRPPRRSRVPNCPFVHPPPLRKYCRPARRDKVKTIRTLGHGGRRPDANRPSRLHRAKRRRFLPSGGMRGRRRDRCGKAAGGGGRADMGNTRGRGKRGGAARAASRQRRGRASAARTRRSRAACPETPCFLKACLSSERT